MAYLIAQKSTIDKSIKSIKQLIGRTKTSSEYRVHGQELLRILERVKSKSVADYETIALYK